MIHNGFRRIALAQGLLPNHGAHAGHAGFAETGRETASAAPVRRAAGGDEKDAGFRPPSPGQAIYPPERQIQV